MGALNFLRRFPGRCQRLGRAIRTVGRGQRFGSRIATDSERVKGEAENPFRAYFDSVNTGPGIWKWRHYFDIYERHFARFRGRSDVQLLEIGIYSGGSLGMWRQVIGSGCHVHGVDIEPACRAYTEEGVSIHIGDQADRAFWGRLKEELPPLDIIIDDGGHLPEQQIVTLEEALPLLKPGGVFVCEDIHHPMNLFHFYVMGLASQLNVSEPAEALPDGFRVPANGLQELVESVSFYPYAVVIETRSRRLGELRSQKRGTAWQPFFG